MGKVALSVAAQRFPWRIFPFPSTKVRLLQPRAPKARGFFLAWGVATFRLRQWIRRCDKSVAG